MLFDAHAHLNNESLKEEDRKLLVKEIEESDVSYMIDSGFDLESSQLAVTHGEKYDWCFATVGYHPHDAKDLGDLELMMLESLAKKDSAVAIGEIGLDFYYDHSPRELQEEAFRKQIRLANKLKMPIVIHSREADQKVLDVLKEEQAFSPERKSWFPKRKGPENTLEDDARVLLHCFSGSKELAEQYVKLGATISIAGPVTFKNNKKTHRVVEAIPLEFLTIETDSPYLTPEPFRGKKNKSPYVEFVARKIAEIKGITYEEVANQTLENAKTFFNIK